MRCSQKCRLRLGTGTPNYLTGFGDCLFSQSPKTDNFTHITEVQNIVREILTAQFEFVQGVLTGAFRIAWCPPPAIAKRGEAAIQQYFEIKHHAAPGTYRFLEECLALKVQVEIRSVEGISRASNQTEILLPEDAPDALKQSLFDITRAQDLDRKTADAYYQTDAWEQEDES